jgi:pantetheine-phosphate adenylyltransferase
MPAQAPTSQLIGIYPGSFDPLTNGHLDVITRASRLIDRLIVAILHNTQKQTLFSVEERAAMIREAISGIGNVEVDSFTGLLVDYAAKRSANVIVRGIRAISDYEAELQMALMNRRMRPELETIFLMAAEEYSFISSRLIKEIIMLKGDVSRFVPPAVTARLQAKLGNNR